MSDDIQIIRASDVMEQMMTRLERRWKQQDEWEASPNRWDFDGVPAWRDIAEREPRLTHLAYQAEQLGYRDRDSYVLWYRHIKPQIEQLVGHSADDQPPPLQTSQVYDVVYQHLLKLYEVGS